MEFTILGGFLANVITIEGTPRASLSHLTVPERDVLRFPGLQHPSWGVWREGEAAPCHRAVHLEATQLFCLRLKKLRFFFVFSFLFKHI